MHDGFTPLYIAAQNGHYKIFKLIFERLSDTNRNHAINHNQGNTPLHIAANNGHLNICKIILEDVTDKNPANDGGWTPLHLAADNGHLEIYKLISDKLTVKNPKSNNGVTPQDLASKYCPLIHTTTLHSRIYKFMLESFSLILGIYGLLYLNEKYSKYFIKLDMENN